MRIRRFLAVLALLALLAPVASAQQQQTPVEAACMEQAMSDAQEALRLRVRARTEAQRADRAEQAVSVLRERLEAILSAETPEAEEEAKTAARELLGLESTGSEDEHEST